MGLKEGVLSDQASLLYASTVECIGRLKAEAAKVSDRDENSINDLLETVGEILALKLEGITISEIAIFATLLEELKQVEDQLEKKKSGVLDAYAF